MSRVLLAEDSSTQAMQIRLLLEEAGFEVALATNGLEAIQAIQVQTPDLVLADLEMPGMNGLELVEAISRDHSSIPVVLITQYGNEEIAVQALRKGAASYVPKRNLIRDIVTTIDEVLVVSSAHHHEEWVLQCMTQTESQFVLENNTALIPPLIGYLQQNLRRMKHHDESELIRIAIAINEALTNAIYHGNLEVSSEVLDRAEDEYYALIDRRRTEPPYRDRSVYVTARESNDEVTYVVRDEGSGFDPASLPDPTDPANVMRVSGRGLLLIRTFMDEVYHNDRGNQITMIKRRAK